LVTTGAFVVTIGKSAAERAASLASRQDGCDRSVLI